MLKSSRDLSQAEKTINANKRIVTSEKCTKNPKNTQNSSRGLSLKRKREIFEDAKDGIFFPPRSSGDGFLFQKEKDQNKLHKKYPENLLKDDALKDLHLKFQDL